MRARIICIVCEFGRLSLYMYANVNVSLLPSTYMCASVRYMYIKASRTFAAYSSAKAHCCRPGGTVSQLRWLFRPCAVESPKVLKADLTS